MKPTYIIIYIQPIVVVGINQPFQLTMHLSSLFQLTTLGLCTSCVYSVRTSCLSRLAMYRTKEWEMICYRL